MPTDPLTPEEIAVKKLAAKYVAPISEAELAVLMCEASYGLSRPVGLTAEQALDAMEDDSREGWRRAARAAMDYWRRCIEQANRTN